MYRYLVSVFVAFMIVHLYRRYRAGEMSSRRLLAWMAFWAGVAWLSWMPQYADRLTELLGVGRGVDLLFFIAILMLATLLLNVYLQLEKQRMEITALVRELALRDLERRQERQEDEVRK